jgi:hypothetical protein
VLPANSSPQAVAIGDLNGDGSLDLATANSGTRRVSSLVNNGSGMFTTSLKSGSTGQFPDALAIGDLNHDGLADVATANGSGNSVTLYLGTSTGTSITDPSLNFPDAVAIGDLNNDGFNDIAVANEDASTVTLFTQVPASPGTFTTSTVAVGDAPSSVAIGDLNGDGLPDLVVANESDNTVSVFLQNAGGGLNSTATVTLPTGDATAPISVAIGDLNGDSRADLAVANNNNNTATVFLQNANGPFGFTAQTPLATGGGPYSIVIGDLNGDGQPDLAVANNSNTFTTGPTNTVTVFLQNADGSYSPTTVPVGSGPQRVVIGDLAGKGRLDLATSNMFSNNVTLLANTTPQSTSAALAPSPTSSNFGQPVAFTTTISPDVNGLRGQAAPTGTVTYTVDGVTLPPIDLTADATAVLPTAALGVGAHAISAAYSGDGNYAPSATTSTFTVTGQTTVTGAVPGSVDVTGATSITDAQIAGSVTVDPGATLDLENSTVGEGISASGAGGIRICATTIHGAVSITGSTGLVVIGDAGDAQCPINTIGGAFTLSDNTAGVEAIGNQVGGLVTPATPPGTNSGPGPFPPDDTVLSGNTANPTVELSATSVAFADTVLGSAAAAQTVTVTNGGLRSLDFGTVALAGGSAAEFGVGSDTCANETVAPGGQCSVAVTFVPTAAGGASATLVLDSNAPSSPDQVSLSGTGITPQAVALSISRVTFAQTVVGGRSVAQTITLTDSGQAPLTVSAVALSGGDAGQFALSANTCTGTIVLSGQHCSIAVVFAPTNAGAHSAASLQFSTNAASSPDVVALSGTAITPPAAAISPTSGTFATTVVGAASPGQAFTVTNGGQQTLEISAAALTGGDAGQFTLGTDGCSGATLAGGAQCSVTVAFTPTTGGSHTADLEITSNAASSSDSIGLSGAAITPPQLAPSATSLAFGSVTVGAQSAAQTITVTNTGQAPLSISSAALAGGDAVQYALSANGCAGAVLVAGAQCSVGVVFKPTSAGVHAGAALTISSNAATTPASLALTGTGVAAVAAKKPPAPSNVVALTKLKGAAKGSISFELRFPDAGRYTLSATTKLPATKAKKGKKAKKATTIAYATTKSVAVRRAVVLTIHVTPGARAKSVLKTDGKLRVTLRLTFTPTGGTRRTTTVSVTAKSK